LQNEFFKVQFSLKYIWIFKIIKLLEGRQNKMIAQ
jgi:hypothetical protein